MESCVQLVHEGHVPGGVLLSQKPGSWLASAVEVVLQVLQAVMKAGEELREEGVVPCSEAGLCCEEVEDVHDHQMMET
ncbi:hypothetical protein QTO34_005584, partial [Cnephaeus nilssonii]